MYLRSIFFAVVLLVVSPVWAQEKVCGVIQSYKDILVCAESRAPEIRQAEASATAGRAQIKASSQWTNPDFSFQTLNGHNRGKNNNETDIALVFPLDFSGRLSAKEAQAKGESQFLEADLQKARLTTRMQTMIQLHRLRQGLRQRELLNESIQTFAKLVKIYDSRPQLTPEQQVSLALFRMAKSDYLLKMTEAEEHIAELEAWFKKTTALEASQIRKNLPPDPQKWPEVSDSVGGGGKSPRRIQLEAEIAKAQADLSLAQAEAWPVLNIGPAVKLLNDDGESSQLYGINLSFPLPVFNANGAGKTAARENLKAFEVKNALLLQEEPVDRSKLIATYRASVKSLNAVVSSVEMEKKHGNIEQLFLRGLVSGALVIEAHRGLVDLEQSRSDREIKTLEALFGIYLLNGESPEVNL